MFRAIILPIFKSTRMCITACGIMHPRCCPKHFELTGIINKPLLLHLVGCLYYLFFIVFLRLAKQSHFIPLQNVVYFITLPFLVRKIFTFYIMMCYYLNVHFQGQMVNLGYDNDNIDDVKLYITPEMNMENKHMVKRTLL